MLTKDTWNEYHINKRGFTEIKKPKDNPSQLRLSLG